MRSSNHWTPSELPGQELSKGSAVRYALVSHVLQVLATVEACVGLRTDPDRLFFFERGSFSRSWALFLEKLPLWEILQRIWFQWDWSWKWDYLFR